MLAEDCAAEHWCAALDGHRERGGQWRANCPYPGCGAERALEWDAPGKTIRWKTWCADHDKETLRPILLERLQGCLSQRRTERTRISPDDVVGLVLGDLPPMTMRLRLLQLAGMGTQEALDKLGVRPDHRARVIGGRTGAPRPNGRETAGRHKP